jgi:protein TonB
LTGVATSHGQGRAPWDGLTLVASAALHVLVCALFFALPGKPAATAPVSTTRTIEFTITEPPPPPVHADAPPPAGAPAAQVVVKKPRQVAPPREIVAHIPPPIVATKEIVAPVPPPVVATKEAGAPVLSVPPVSPAQPGGGHDPRATGTGATGTSAGGAPGGAGGSAKQPVTGPSYVAAYLHNPPPGYPALARRLRLQGTTIVRVLVSPDGHPQRVAVETSSGVQMLDDAPLLAGSRMPI